MTFSITEPVHRLFNHPGLRRWLLRLRIPIALLLVALWPWWVRPELIWAGLGISLIGEAIQLWCFACLEKEKVLTIRGPYQLCRNPMYLGRYLLILGFVVTTGNAFMMVLYTLFYWFYMVNRVQREEPVLEKIFDEPYRLYCRQVNRFLPGTKRLDRHFWFFNWKIMFENHGHWNLLAVVAGYGYLLGFQALVV